MKKIVSVCLAGILLLCYSIYVFLTPATPRA